MTQPEAGAPATTLPAHPLTPPSAAHDAHGNQRRRIRGPRLRELLVLILSRQAAPMTVAQLVAAVDASGFRIEGRAGKVVSDQLRYEIARGRVQRLGRGVYGAGTVTRQARWRMQRRIRALRADPPSEARDVCADAAATG